MGEDVNNATLFVYRDQDENAVIARATQSLTDWIQKHASTLGNDIIPSQISAALSVPGMYKVSLSSPAEHILTKTQWAHCTGMTLIPGGKSHE